jgi:hypothetical protein
LKLRKREADRIKASLRCMDIQSFRILYAGLHNLDHTMKSSPKELARLSFEQFIAGLGT